MQLLHHQHQRTAGTDLGDLLDRHVEHERPRARPAVLCAEREPEEIVLGERLADVLRVLGLRVDLGCPQTAWAIWRIVSRKSSAPAGSSTSRPGLPCPPCYLGAGARPTGSAQPVGVVADAAVLVAAPAERAELHAAESLIVPVSLRVSSQRPILGDAPRVPVGHPHRARPGPARTAAAAVTVSGWLPRGVTWHSGRSGRSAARRARSGTRRPGAGSQRTGSPGRCGSRSRSRSASR